MFRRLRSRLKRGAPGRFLEALQVEVTSRCCVRCEMCPHNTLTERWPETDMAWQTFEHVAQAFPHAAHVHLQGWGEPLLHPRLFEMIPPAKAAGCRVGLTTNGVNLSREAATRLLDLRLDLLAVSIAGASQETHEGIRVSSSFPEVLENVRRFTSLRAQRPGGGPKIELSYLMTATNIAELPQAVDLAASLGVDELYAINLDYVMTPAHDTLRVFGRPLLRAEALRAVEEAQDRARRQGVTFRPYPFDLEEVAVCEAQPPRILFISCEGWVAPCAYLSLPGQREIPRLFAGQSVTVPAVRFGNILEQELLEIWESPVYVAFRQRFEARLASRTPWAMAAMAARGEGQVSTPEPPEPCRTCYKLYGA
jgi:MoaA/NifB/PqqE/SkfB family radical SAM enzyme